MNIFQLSPVRTGRRLLAAALLTTTAALALLHTPALASSGSQYSTFGQYGEVTRFGGFDATWFDEGKYDGSGSETQPTSGKLLDPVGFAVDTDDSTVTDGTAIYVLDRVSGWGAQAGADGTEWRLQKFSDTGAVLGTTEFYLPADLVTEADYEVFTGAVGLAIDDKTGRIYTLIYGSTGEEEGTTRQVEEIIDLSTAPVGGLLIAPPGSSKIDSPSTPITPVSGYSHPGVLSTSQLEDTPLYEPQGLALDVTGGHDYLAIQADASTRSSSGHVQGPAIVEQVSTENGDETGSWSASSLTSVANASSAYAKALAAGISTNPDGSLDVLLSVTGDKEFGVLDDVNLPADLTGTPTVLVSGAIDPNRGESYPSAGKDDDPDPTVVGNTTGTLGQGGGDGASAQVVELANGLYASDFQNNTGGTGYWDNSSTEGIRLIAPEANGLLTNPLAPVTSIFDTLGNATPAGACNIGNGEVSGATNDVSLAAGANGTVWVLTSGGDSSGYGGSGPDAAFTSGRQIIELSPDKGTPCAGPAGTFTLANAAPGSPTQSASSPLKVSVGSTVDFNASTIEYPSGDAGKPAGIYAYEWDPTLGAAGDAGYTVISDKDEENGLAPATTASHQYTSPGVYQVGLKLLGDFGEYDETGTVEVQTTEPPVASFTAPAEVQVNQPASFDASDSTHPSGVTIADYHWSFGDGQSDDSQTAVDTHEYTAPGVYTVTLTVRDNDNQSSAPVSQQITVASPPPSGKESTSQTTTSTTTTPQTVGPPVIANIDRSATNLNPKAIAAKSQVLVTITCPATKVSCAGTVAVKTAGAVAARVADGASESKASKKGGKFKKSLLVLGQKAFSLTGGQRETLTIKLSAKGLALLEKSKRLKVDVLISAHDSYGDPGTQTLTLTLTAPAKKKVAKK